MKYRNIFDWLVQNNVYTKFIRVFGIEIQQLIKDIEQVKAEK